MDFLGGCCLAGGGPASLFPEVPGMSLQDFFPLRRHLRFGDVESGRYFGQIHPIALKPARCRAGVPGLRLGGASIQLAGYPCRP